MIKKSKPSYTTRLSESELNNALETALAFAKGDKSIVKELTEFFPKDHKPKLPAWWYCQLACDIVQYGCLNIKQYPPVPIIRLAKYVGPYLWYALAMAESDMNNEEGCDRVLQGIANNFRSLRLSIFEQLRLRSSGHIESLNLEILNNLIPKFPNDSNNHSNMPSSDEIFRAIDNDRNEGKEINHEQVQAGIWALLREGKVKEASQKIMLLHGKGKNFSRILIWDIFNKLAESNDIKSLIDYASFRQEYGYYLNIKDLSIILKSARIKTDSAILTEAVKLVESIELVPDEMLLQELLCAYEQLKQPEAAHRVFNNALKSCLPLSQHHYNTMISVCAQEGNLSEAVEFFEQAKKIAPKDTVIYCSLISAYAKAGDAEQAQAVFDRMLAEGLKPDTFHYGALIDAYGSSNLPEMAESILRSLPEELSLTAEELGYLYNLVIKGYSHANQTDDINRLKDEMIQKGLPLDRYTLGSTGRAYESSGFIQDGRHAVRSSEAEQWKELSTLFEDVIHELNQPIGIIGSTTKTALNYIKKGNLEKAKTSLEKLSTAVEDLGNRISVYKALTQRSSAEETVRVSDLVNEVKRVLQRQAEKANVKIDVEIFDQNRWNRVLYLKGDPFLYRIAIRALVHNAIQACSDPSLPEERRHVIIRGIYTPSISDDVKIAPFGWIDIYVRDQGSGIPPDHRQKIFERGFTTKKGRGLGLGLSLVQSVAESYGGRIRLLENVSPGVEFWLRLPAEFNSRRR